MDGYLVQQPFADQLASGNKSWDVRVRPIALPRKPFYILATRKPHNSASDYDPQRLGVAVAVAESKGTIGPISVNDMIAHVDKHLIPADILREYAKGRPLYAMQLTTRAIEPRRYVQKTGAIHLIVSVQFV